MILIDVRDKGAHFTAGLVASLVPLAYGIIVIFLFMTYEFVETWKIKDKAYPEIREFTAGFITGLVYRFHLEGGLL